MCWRERTRLSSDGAGFVNKRLLVSFVAILLLAVVQSVGAQQPKKIPRIGLLRPGSPPDPYVDAFRQGLRDLGYVEGKNIAIEYRWAEGKSAELPVLATELVHLKVDVIETRGEVATVRSKTRQARSQSSWRPLPIQWGPGSLPV